MIATRALLIGAVLSTLVRYPGHSMTTACSPADTYSAHHISYLKGIVTSTETKAVQWRTMVHLPAVADSAVVLVSDSTTCAQGLTAYNNLPGFSDGPATSLYLIRVGPSFVASNPLFPSGEYVAQIVFDSTFTYKATYLK